MERYELSAAQWHRVESFLRGRPGWVGVTARDDRTFVNGVRWVLRSGAQWKRADLPRAVAHQHHGGQLDHLAGPNCW